MLAAQSRRPSVPVLVPDHLAVLDLDPDERRQVHRFAEHLVVLLVVDQNLKHADAYPVSSTQMLHDCSVSRCVYYYQPRL